jgi:hypothetical protein
VLAFSRRPVFLRVGWFAKRTGPCTTEYYRQFTTDNNIINKPVNKKKIVDDDEDEDEEVKEIFRLKDNNVEKKYVYLRVLIILSYLVHIFFLS